MDKPRKQAVGNPRSETEAEIKERLGFDHPRVPSPALKREWPIRQFLRVSNELLLVDDPFINCVERPTEHRDRGNTEKEREFLRDCWNEVKKRKLQNPDSDELCSYPGELLSSSKYWIDWRGECCRVAELHGADFETPQGLKYVLGSDRDGKTILGLIPETSFLD